MSTQNSFRDPLMTSRQSGGTGGVYTSDGTAVFTPQSVLGAKVRAAAGAAGQSNAVINTPYLQPGVWAPSTVYGIGQVVVGLDGVNTYICQTGGTSAVSGGPTGNGYALITDNTVIWEWFGIVRGEGLVVANANAPAWAANTVYTAGALVTSSDGYNVYTCVKAGTSAVSPALGPVGYRSGATVPDGTATWRWYGINANKPVLSYNTVANVQAAVGTYRTLQPTIAKPLFKWTGGIFAPDPGAVNLPGILGPDQGSVTSSTILGGNSAAITFYTDAAKIGFHGVNAVYNGDNYAVEVNNRLVTDDVFYNTSFTNPGAVLLDLSMFGKNTHNKVRIWSMGSFANLACNQIYLEASGTIWVEESQSSYSLVAEGDSLTAGGNNTPLHGGLDWVSRAATMLGCDSWANMAVGGTGFISNSNGTKMSYIQRLPRLLTLPAGVYIIAGNHNDASYSAQDQITAVITYLRALRDGNPNAHIIVFGNNLLQGESSTLGAIYNAEVNLASAFAQWADGNSTFVPILTDTKYGAWMNGTGSISAPANDGNMDRYSMPSGGHPTQRGVLYLGDRYTQALKKVFGM